MSIKNFSLSGMPDFSSIEVKRRDYVFSIMKKIFEKYGYSPLETPALEKRETLVGKYGEDGDKLIYQILKSGDFTLNLKENDFQRLDYKKMSSIISDKALRYDLTIPFSRYVSQNKSNISFPFKRYQIQKVWRADRPQKGRLREFTQCDVDVIGSSSLWLESDLIKIYDEVFYELGCKNIVLKLNNRKILEGVYSSLFFNFSFSKFCTSLDKIDKRGRSFFFDFLKEKGASKKDLSVIDSLLKESIPIKKLDDSFLKFIGKKNRLLKEGINELLNLSLKINSTRALKVEFDFSLARGLDYYTGMIFEVKNEKIAIGSLGGGGEI